MKYKYKNSVGGEFEFGELGHKILTGCKKAEEHNTYYEFTTTNSDIKKFGRVPLVAEEVGMLLFDLKKLGIIDYEYVETGRKAQGSGRFELINKFKFIGKVE